MSRVRVLVVDDSAFSRQTIKNMLESDESIEVVGIAPDGINAITKTLKLKPDLITLDLEMPEMDGFSFLRWLMQQRPTPVIMVSSYADSKTVFKALELGAVDFIAKPTVRASVELRNIEKDLLRKVHGVKSISLNALTKARQLHGEAAGAAGPPLPKEADIKMVAIGSSTGGPPALQVVLTELPENFPAAIAISQHMPAGFTRSLAERLNSLCGVHVKEAEQGDAVQEGRVLLCPGGHHMEFRRRGGAVKVNLRKARVDDMYVPSVDFMMGSAAEVYGSGSMGVILTGMGNDGTEGARSIARAGGINIVESEETAVVYGMPADVVKAGVANKVLSLDKIAWEIMKIVASKP
ncbi:MAG: chemotaxis response regulator protein-glutamate methylesterase [Nitrospirota bacterium]|jgi:two-component system chemotaxis response regulator CheB